MNYYYDPLDKASKSITGGISKASNLTLRLIEKESGEGNFSAQTCNLVLWKDAGETARLPMTKSSMGFEITLRFIESGLYFYHFELDGAPLGRGKLRRGEWQNNPCSWEITVFEEEYKTPDWLKGGVIYQIFPDRFYKSGDIPIAEHKIFRSDWGGTPRFRPNEYGKIQNNDFFGGNLRGIKEKLPYLKELGVSAIYLNPIFEAYSNHRYDTGDYRKIDSLLGTEEDFDLLVKSAQKYGIGIILDGVFNHTGDDSRYFNKYGRYDEVGAYQSTKSPYSDWYNFREFPASYDSWWGIETLPAVNETSESYQNFMFGDDGVIRHWLRHGTMGWRIDVADELPDFFLQKLRTAAKSLNPNAVIIGEVWEDASDKISYDVRRKYFQGLELDSVMNYPLKDAIIDYVLSGKTTALRETVRQLIDNYPKQSLDSLMNILGTHDTVRILTVLGNEVYDSPEIMANARLSEEGKKRAKEKLKMAALLQYTLPGVPCIFYGDENGQEGYRDPFCRRCFDWDNVDEELQNYYRRLGRLRGEYSDIFKEGEFIELFADQSCIVYERRCKNQSVIVYLNNGGTPYNVDFKGKYLNLLSGDTIAEHFEIPAYSYGILTKSK